MLIVSILVAVVLLAVLGAVLIWVPVIALLVAAGAILRMSAPLTDLIGTSQSPPGPVGMPAYTGH